MDFRFTEEQDMTAEVVRTLLSDLCKPADLRRLMASGEAMDGNRWDKIVELGLQGALVPEEKGGLGLAPVDFVQIAEACGYACLPEPLVENAGVAAPLLATLGPQAAAALDAVLEGTATVALGHPINPFVEWADHAGYLILAGEKTVSLVARDSADLVQQPSIDPFRRLFTVEAGAAIATFDAQSVAPALAAALDRGALFSAAQLLGIAQRSVDLAVEYAKERKQFGKPIGSYQAIKHLLANAQVKIEFARPVLHAAAANLPDGDLFSKARVSHAKLVCAEAADFAARTAIQVHGAMGYSWEVDVHFFLKRAIALSQWWGGPGFHEKRVGARVFDAPLGPEFTFAKGSDHG